MGQTFFNKILASAGIFFVSSIVLGQDSLFLSSSRWIHLGDSHLEIGITPEVFYSKLDSTKSRQKWYFPYKLSPTFYHPSLSLDLKGNWKTVSSRKVEFIANSGLFQKGFQLESNSGSWKFNVDTLYVLFRGEHPKWKVNNRITSKVIQLHEDLYQLELHVSKWRKEVKWEKTNTLFLRVSDRSMIADYPAYFSCGLSGGKWEGLIANSNLFNADLASIQADFLVITLGTNDAYDASLDTVAWKHHFHVFISNVKRDFPSIVLFLSTPPLTFFRNQFPPHVDFIRREILSVQDSQTHVFDWYGEMISHPEIWQQPGIYQDDRLHFTVKGYTLFVEKLWDFIQNESK